MPDGVHDRPADVWEPLLAIADAAGGDWPVLARAACVELVKVVENREASLGVKLLTDLRTVFGDQDAMVTEVIIEALCNLDESPWGDLYGKPVDSRRIARILAGYGIKSVQVWTDGRNLRGYKRSDMWDAWSRYLPTTESKGTTGAQTLGTLGTLGQDQTTTSHRQLPSPPSSPSASATPEPQACPHGMPGGAEPDPFLGGRIACPECRAAVVTK